MPKIRSNIGRSTRKANQKRVQRLNQNPGEQSLRKERNRLHMYQSRENATVELRELHNELNRLAMRQTRTSAANSDRLNFDRLAFHYNPTADYNSHNNIAIGNMDKVCTHCKALKYKNEAPGLCCVNGKVKLTELN